MSLPPPTALREAARLHSQNFLTMSDMETCAEGGELLAMLIDETAMGLYLLLGTDETVALLTKIAQRVSEQPPRSSLQAERDLEAQSARDAAPGSGT